MCYSRGGGSCPQHFIGILTQAAYAIPLVLDVGLFVEAGKENLIAGVGESHSCHPAAENIRRTRHFGVKRAANLRPS
jgi:hypothetical protein